MTGGLTTDDFAPFFRGVHGVDPFPWQVRLLRAVAQEGRWPDVLDLPTGTGKTAALDIAVFHLALDVQKGEARRAPTRIVFAVDRRLIVDDAFGRAQKLQKALAFPQSRLLEQVAAALRALAGDRAPPLLARRLRGGAPREDDWARTPNQPTILCSTVDQAGSRLLFRGYGVSNRMKPVQAGLLGSDCLILLDEAHLAEPFRQTLASIAELRDRDATVAPWRVAVLSATPGKRSEVDRFSLDDDDRRHPLLARRLGARKPAALIEVAGKQGVAAETRRVEEVADRAMKTLDGLRRYLQSPAVGVVVNRVARARAVFDRLSAALADARVVLVIGPARLADREEVVAEDLRDIRTDAQRSLAMPLVVVATQTIEAGVDIDFDGLVTEAAALDSLRQRFGRLNRGGRAIVPVAAVLAHKEDIGTRADDPVYGDRIAKTWEALNVVAESGVGSEPTVDFGIDSFPRALAEDSDSLVSAKKNAPILLPAYADLWSQTSPIPEADPDVSLFLHGPERSPASVQVLWRADVAEADLDDRERFAALLDLVPPRPAETIEVPIWAARALLREEAAAQHVLSDISEKAPEEVDRRGRRAFRYAGSDDDRRTGAVFAGDLRNGDLIVVPAGYGGCDQWGWAPGSTKAVIDLAEKAAEPYSMRRFAVRVTPELIQQWMLGETRDGEAFPTIEVTRAGFGALLAEHRDETASALLDAVLGLSRLPPEIRRRLEQLNRRRGVLERVFAYGDDTEDRPRGVVFLARKGIRASPAELEPEWQDGAAATEDDWLGSAPGFAQTLEEHSREVRDLANEFAIKIGVGAELADDIALAAFLHDEGKADRRFQAMLYGGDWSAVDETMVLAKSAARVGPAAWEKAGLPDRWRHEALSVRRAREHPRFREAHDPELVLWLIGVHHGYGRPLFPHTDPEESRDRAGPQSLDFDFAGCDWALIFERMKRAYGIWGLARLEAFVRLADHRASEAAARRYAEGKAS